jgi:hypothetical protein
MRAGSAVSAAALVVSLLAACGTTVPLTSRATSGSDTTLNGSTTDPSSGRDGETPTLDGQSPTGPAASVAPASSGAGGAATGAGASVPGSSAGGSADVTDRLQGMPGITARTVKIGIETAGNAAALRAAFGLPDPSTPDLGAVLKVVFDHVNRHGGFGGRRGEFVTHETDLSDGNFETQSQAACAAFTEDLKVFAAVSAVSRTPSIFNCLAKHRTIGLAYYPGHAIPLSTWDGAADYLYGPVYLAHPRSSILVDTWIRMGLLTRSSRIGIISIDDPAHQAFAQAVRDGLKRHSLALTDEFKASAASQLSDLGRAGNEMNSAVLQFRSHNVDVVLFANTAGGGPALFMPAAEDQRYQPRYGVSSYEFLETAVSLAPPAALERSVGPGWLPDFDLTDPRYLPKNPERTACMKILRDGGIQVSAKAEMSIGEVCQFVFLIRDGMNGVHSGKARTFRAAVESLGHYRTANGDPLLFGPGRHHDAIGEYREMRFTTDCGCFHYTKGPFPIP